MDITIQNNPEIVTAIMSGCFDTLATEQAEPLIKELESLATKPMVLDCNALEYVASSGLRALLRLCKACSANRQSITMLGVNENVMEVLKVTHFDKLFIMK